MVVMAVAVTLMALLMPAMSQVRENTHRIVCSTNQRQIGQGIFAYAADNRDRLPASEVLHTSDPNPQELMATRCNITQGHPLGWDGLGLLYFHSYCGTASCYYCPSHHGNHPYERYESQWQTTGNTTALIYSNFHYCGDIDWNTGDRRSLHTDGYGLALITDGLRTAQDFNHRTGMNVVRGDGSVRWRDDIEGIVAQLPANEHDHPGPGYKTMWNNEIEDFD